MNKQSNSWAHANTTLDCSCCAHSFTLPLTEADRVWMKQHPGLVFCLSSDCQAARRGMSLADRDCVEAAAARNAREAMRLRGQIGGY